MSGQACLDPAEAFAGEGDDRQVAEEGGHRDAHHQEADGRRVSRGEQGGRNDQAATRQDGNQPVERHGSERDDDQARVREHRTHVDLHGSIVSNVQ
ncbi:hypothetical protein N566_06480 [Streptomycetaceae bacterium MP113-05]|nr:hypothetical protein N566_06480 [Streptomycetaceae bacterium MP113-05]